MVRLPALFLIHVLVVSATANAVHPTGTAAASPVAIHFHGDPADLRELLGSQGKWPVELLLNRDRVVALPDVEQRWKVSLSDSLEQLRQASWQVPGFSVERVLVNPDPDGGATRVDLFLKRLWLIDLRTSIASRAAHTRYRGEIRHQGLLPSVIEGRTPDKHKINPATEFRLSFDIEVGGQIHLYECTVSFDELRQHVNWLRRDGEKKIRDELMRRDSENRVDPRRGTVASLGRVVFNDIKPTMIEYQLLSPQE